MKPPILIDLDNTILDFNGAFGKFLLQRGISVPQNFIPSDPHWDKDPIFKGREDEILEGYEDFVESGLHTPPLEGAREFLEKIHDVWDIVYCTAREGRAQIEPTYRAFHQYKFPLSHLVFSRNKKEIALCFKCEVAIDDSPEMVESLKEACTVLVPKYKYNSEPRIDGVHYIGGFTSALETLEKLRS